MWFIFKYLFVSQLILSTAFAFGAAPSPLVTPFRHEPGFMADLAYYKGDIHTIWFSLDGSIPKHAIQNLKEWNQAVLARRPLLDYKIHLWTFKDKVETMVVNDLETAGIVVHHVRDVAQEDAEVNQHLSNLAAYASEKKQWYYSAFAVMSDILRIHLMGQAPRDRFYIYADINDTTFEELAESLRALGARAQSNYAPFDAWKGFAFPRLDGQFTFNNDLIIARREGHEIEVEEFKTAYMRHVGARLTKYMQKAHLQWETCPGDVARLVFATSHADKVVSRYARFVPNAAQLIAYKHRGANTWVRKREVPQIPSAALKQMADQPASSSGYRAHSPAKRVAASSH